MNRLAAHLLRPFATGSTKGLSILMALLVAGCSSSETDTTTPRDSAIAQAPVVGEQLQIVPPNGWRLSASSNRGQFRRARYVRDNNDSTGAPGAPQTVESLTFEYMNPEGLPDPIQFLEAMSTEQGDRCEAFSSVGIGAAEENGYPSAVRLLSCPYRKVNKSSTVSLAKAIAGNDGYYLIVFEKRAPGRRTDEGWSTDHVTEEDVANWSLYLRNTTVCDSQRSEHPCN